ncbi:hypothetical protein Phum_PHUM369000 [Pediculus humanus corporis]|uniref:Uncharacterized protein n=1 Tax=Pediculus humanus subsp. corporis TaxID=121224 RepID=E0VPZ4_PEDHC|nr:uncharacterized protein Phum_PHUM369000 [Pediculus humanus corporis]EEB15450.1 hypothetical protein Phum_PHUM369000 [Pediculus humanus corporis]
MIIIIGMIYFYKILTTYFSKINETYDVHFRHYENCAKMLLSFDSENDHFRNLIQKLLII